MRRERKPLFRTIRLSDNDERILKIASLHTGEFLSEFIREAAVARARRELTGLKVDENRTV